MLKGTPTPDSRFTMELPNKLIEEEGGKRPAEENMRVSYKEFRQRWAYPNRQF